MKLFLCKTRVNTTLNFWVRISITILVGCFLCGVAFSQENEEWPCFHGTSRTNMSTETNLLPEWPSDGPKLLWTISGLGKGFSSVAIANGRLFTAGVIENQTFVFSYDLDGNLIWKKPNGQSWEASRAHAKAYKGSRSTPTFDENIVYHLGDTGRLAAFDYLNGTEKWAIELREVFDAEIPDYGYTESVLVEGDFLYCQPAGKKGFFVCLNKKNGELVWATTGIPGALGFNSPVIAEFGGSRQIISLSSNCVFGLDIKSGKLLWTFEYKNSRDNNCTDALISGNYIFVSSGYGKGSALLKLKNTQNTFIPELVWQTELMDNHHGGVILHDGYLYGAGHNERGWFCLDFKTGEQTWKASGKGSLVYANNMLYLFEEKGTVKLVKANPKEYTETGSFEIPDKSSGMLWAHPVVCGGRLYVRDADRLFAYDIKTKKI